MAAPDRTHYDVLGLARDADASAVRTAWKLHVQAWHPDRFTGEMREEAERQTSRINEAYNTLRDASRRAAYDCRLAADEASARPQPEPRRSAKVRPAAPRPAATPVGAPMAPPIPMTVGEQVAVMIDDAGRILRRHPRIVAAAATLLVLVFGGSAVLHVVSGPSLPSSTSTASAAPAPAMVANEEQVEDLEELAERARLEAAEADAELQKMMEADARAAQAEAQAAAREAALAAQAARRAAKAKGTKAAPARRGTRRIVRVMPTNATV